MSWRQNNAYFATFPFLTDLVTTVEKFVDAEPLFQPQHWSLLEGFFSALDKLEHERPEHWDAFECLVGTDISHSSEFQKKHRAKATAQCYLFAYFLADQWYLKFGNEPHPPTIFSEPRYPPLLQSILQSQTATNWAQWIGCSSIEWNNLLLQGRDFTTGTGAAAFPDAHRIPECLLEGIIEFSTLTRTSGIMANILGAALYLAHVNEHQNFTLPTVSELTAKFPEEKHSASQYANLTRLDIPIYTAATLSPFLLFGETNLCMSQPTMTDFTKAWFLGRITRPTIIQNIEAELWRVAFKVASGTTSIRAALDDFWQSRPVQGLLNVPHIDTRLIKPSYYNPKRSLEDHEAGEEDEDEEAAVEGSRKRQRIGSAGLETDQTPPTLRLPGPSSSAGSRRILCGNQSIPEPNLASAGASEPAQASIQSSTYTHQTSPTQSLPPPYDEQVERENDQEVERENEGGRQVRQLRVRKGKGKAKVVAVREGKGKAKVVAVREEKGKAKAAAIREGSPTPSQSEDGTQPVSKELTYYRPDAQPAWPGETIQSAKPPALRAKTLFLRSFYAPESETPWTPVVHLKEQVVFYNHVTNVINNLPPDWYHTGNPNAIFRTITTKDFNAYSEDRLQDIFARQSLLVVDSTSTPEVAWDASTFDKIHPGARRTVEAHDFSISEKNSYLDRLQGVSAETLLSAAHDPRQRRILNALDIPNNSRLFSWSENPLASCQQAWHSVAGDTFCNIKEPFPPELSWFLAATEGAYSKWHIDSDGLATRIRPLCGSKLWILGRFKDGKTGSIDRFENFNLDSMNADLLEFAPIWLQPGMTLYMRPCTPHLVLTPLEPTICSGDQFFATATMRPTCHGILHGFAAGRNITNITHAKATHEMLRRYVTRIIHASDHPADAHMPDWEDPESLLDMLLVCIILYLGSAVYPPAYEGQPGPSYSNAMRDDIMEGRRKALELINWTFTHCRLTIKGETVRTPWTQIFVQYLAQVTCALEQYLQGLPQGFVPSPEVDTITAKAFRERVKILRQENPQFMAAYNAIHKQDMTAIGFTWDGQSLGVTREEVLVDDALKITGRSKLEYFPGCYCL